MSVNSEIQQLADDLIEDLQDCSFEKIIVISQGKDHNMTSAEVDALRSCFRERNLLVKVVYNQTS